MTNEYTEKLIDDFASNCHVAKLGAPELVDFIENDLYTASTEAKIAAIKPALNFFNEENVDTIILGCTHFIHMADDIRVLAGDKIQVIDSRDGVVRQALRMIKEWNNTHRSTENENESAIINTSKDADDMAFFYTGIPENKETKSTEEEYKTLCNKLGLTFAGII